MPRTRTDLVVEVLDLIGVTQVGQDPAAEDAEKVDQKIDGLISELSRRRVVHIACSNAIDDEYFDALARLLANRVINKFGGERDDATDFREEGRLREMQQEAGISDTVHALYF